jgi:hypothetical protein
MIGDTLVDLKTSHCAYGLGSDVLVPSHSGRRWQWPSRSEPDVEAGSGPDEDKNRKEEEAVWVRRERWDRGDAGEVASPTRRERERGGSPAYSEDERN